jgi:hypothetical protein
MTRPETPTFLRWLQNSCGAFLIAAGVSAVTAGCGAREPTPDAGGSSTEGEFNATQRAKMETMTPKEKLEYQKAIRKDQSAKK